MTKQEPEILQNATLNDVQLAGVYFPILVKVAMENGRVTYGELLKLAKEAEANKDDVVVQNAIPVSTGRKLAMVRQFTQRLELPDLTSLVISNTKEECGDAYTKTFNAEDERSKVYEFDWSQVSIDFNIFIETETKNAQPKAKSKPKPAVTNEKAKVMMWQYYKENKKLIPESVVKQREKLIELIMSGCSVEDAFSKLIN